MKRTAKHNWLYLTAAVIVAVMMSAAVTAMPPHPSLYEQQAAGKVSLPPVIVDQASLHARGICTGDDDVLRRFLVEQAADRRGNGTSLDTGAGPFRILALLVDFSDHTASVPATYFDSMLFSTNGATVRSFYDEISYSQIDLITVSTEEPSDLGWNRAPQTYAYYVNNNNGMGSYPQNSQGLVNDLVDLVNGSVDFSSYDNDGDNYVDVLLVIHSGTGAEYAGGTTDIWSHKWGLPSAKPVDGVYVRSYTIQPEFWSSPGDMTIGVYCHELGHGFGLPDLYDVDYSSQGIGKWGLMAGGSWNGSLGNSPAHPSAWCRYQMGITTPTNVTTNLINQSIGAVESGGTIFKLTPYGAGANEYFLIENRQKTGFDAALPGSGLLIWHVDESAPSSYGSNSYEWYPGQPTANHFVVALEQADGLFELEQTSGSTFAASDAGDPFPGNTGRTVFNDTGAVNAAAYANDTVTAFVTNISSSQATMTADLIVGLAADVGDDEPVEVPNSIVLAQNYPNPFNPTTVISFTLSQAGEVSVAVYNVLGQHVKTLADGYLAAGEHQVSWDGTESDGSEVGSGVYFYRLTAENGNHEVKKMVLVR
ncbi:M6 family metalloprotease domain-containing protein [bacterium]|nr:M6 family metalloprotease domain-containing protein [bacterium]MCB2201673.1 M6 family metalloprotease domain-containing protein [bacterium]